MNFNNVLEKVHITKKKKPWKWIVGIVLGVLIFGMIFVRIMIGELGELGLLKVSGFPGGNDYLVVFQNDAERRPTGGFITSYAVLKFRVGIPFFEFGNVYDEKLIQKGTLPPSEIMRDLLAGDFYPGHGFRDGNFDPDFPTTAKELMRLYKLGYPEADFDGVIAIDFTAFENLAQALAPEIVGEAGLFSQIENQVQGIDLHDPEAIQTRKDFLADLAKRLIKKAMLHPKQASQSLLESLRAKHVLLYFRDAEIQEIVESKNWGGVLPQQYEGDFLAINEGNYGGMKSSRYLVRDIFYDVEFIPSTDDSEQTEDELTASANLRVNVQHRGDAAEPISGYYKGFWRVFTPLGVERQSGKFEQEFDDGFHQVFGKLIQMNPDEEREIALSYDLPESVLRDGVYRLKIIKQAGSEDDFVRVTLKLPSGYLFQDTGYRIQNTGLKLSDSLEIKENLAVYQTFLDKDKELELRIIPDTVPPRLAWQEFVGRNLARIDLRFNEPLDADSVEQATFELADMNYRNKRFDSVQVRRVRFVPPQNIQLDVAGVTPECREWYELNFDGVADRWGNVLENQRITVVQWVDEFGNNCDPGREL